MLINVMLYINWFLAIIASVAEDFKPQVLLLLVFFFNGELKL